MKETTIKKKLVKEEFRFDRGSESTSRANEFKVSKYLEVWVSVAPHNPEDDTDALIVALAEGSGKDSFGSAMGSRYQIRVEDEDGKFAEEWTSASGLNNARMELKNAVRQFKREYGIELYKDDDWLDMLNEGLPGTVLRESWNELGKDPSYECPYCGGHNCEFVSADDYPEEGYFDGVYLKATFQCLDCEKDYVVNYRLNAINSQKA